MTTLFGVDIAAELASGLEAAGGLLEGTLTTVTDGARDSDNLAGGRAQVEAEITFRGIVEAGARKMDGTRVVWEGDTVLMIAGSFSTIGVRPKVGDRVEIEGVVYNLERLLERDPASATFLFGVMAGAE